MEQVIKGSWLFETYYGMPEFTARADKSALNATRDMVSDRPTFMFPPGSEDKASFAEALNLGSQGWAEELPEALAVAETAIEMAQKEHMVDTFAPMWDVCGSEVDVARYVDGEPENMIDFPLTRTSKEGRVITLAVGTAISSAVTSRTYLKRGRCIVALALALGRLGHAVEIWAYDSSGCNKLGEPGNAHCRVLVKSANDEIDPAALMFTLAHPAMHRALMWAVRDKFPQPWRKGLSLSASRGMPNNDIKDTEREMYPEGTIFLPGLKSFDDVPDADEFLREHLGSLGLLAE
jgi:hypothetical protein